MYYKFDKGRLGHALIIKIIKTERNSSAPISFLFFKVFFNITNNFYFYILLNSKSCKLRSICHLISYNNQFY